MKNIFFIGFMGTGKSTIGKMVADRLGLNFIDTDDEIENRLGISIAQIFNRYGEQYFRRLENMLITELADISDTVIATGGGTPLYHENLEIMKQNSLVITLTTSTTILWKRLAECENRPMLQKYNTFAKFTKLYNDRKSVYNRGDIIIKTDGKSIQTIVAESIEHILAR